MHARLGEYLFTTYPDGGWLVQDDGSGPYIKAWDRPEAQPTADDVDAWCAARSVESALAAIEAEYIAKASVLRERLATIMLVEGAVETGKRAALTVEWQAMQDARDAEILQLLGGI